MPDNDEIRLAAAMAGQVTRDLDGAVTKNTNKIDPHKFIAGLGVQYPQAGFQRTGPTQTPLTRVPGMVQETKLTPAGSEIIGKVDALPELIPIPEHEHKYESDGGQCIICGKTMAMSVSPSDADLINQVARGAAKSLTEIPAPPMPTTDPERKIITEPAPVPAPLNFQQEVLESLSRIEAILNATKRNKQSKKSKRPKARGPHRGPKSNPATPTSSTQTLLREHGNGVSEA